MTATKNTLSTQLPRSSTRTVSSFLDTVAAVTTPTRSFRILRVQRDRCLRSNWYRWTECPKSVLLSKRNSSPQTLLHNSCVPLPSISASSVKSISAEKRNHSGLHDSIKSSKYGIGLSRNAIQIFCRCHAGHSLHPFRMQRFRQWDEGLRVRR